MAQPAVGTERDQVGAPSPPLGARHVYRMRDSSWNALPTESVSGGSQPTHSRLTDRRPLRVPTAGCATATADPTANRGNERNVY